MRGHLTRWFCPSCGKDLSGKTYDLDTGAAKCKGRWHTAAAVPREYVRAGLAVDAIAAAMRNGRPDDGSDADEAVRIDAVLALRDVVAQDRKQQT